MGGDNCCRGLSVAVVAQAVIIVVLAASLMYVGLTGNVDYQAIFDDCTQCKPCLKCLYDFNGEDNVALCSPSTSIKNTIQCTEQLRFLYGRPQHDQPCYSECHQCQDCLKGTIFHQSGTPNASVWDILNPGLFHSLEDKDFPETGGNETAVESSEGCCVTSTNETPYMTQLSEGGTVWYPVWYKLSQEDPKYQFYDGGKCQSGSANCGSCTVQNTLYTFLFSTITPDADSGYAYTLITFDDDRTAFYQQFAAGYCRCVGT